MADLVYMDKDTFADGIANIKNIFDLTDPMTLNDIFNNNLMSYGTVTITGVSYNTNTGATTNTVTVNHNLNKMPRYILFFKTTTANGSKVNTNVSQTTSSYYRTYTEILNGYADLTTQYISSNYLYYTSYRPGTSQNYSSIVRGFTRRNLVTSTSISDTYDITNITETTFDLPKNLSNNASYFWVAF